GIVENMSTHICSNCGHEEHIFGAGGASNMCADYNVDLLGSLPLDISIREQTDNGNPSVIHAPDSKIANIYKEIARKAAIKIANASLDHSRKFPNIVIQNT
ncbi:MAG: P-loop NTPase, partial [Pseudomonadota bacterium]